MFWASSGIGASRPASITLGNTLRQPSFKFGFYPTDSTPTVRQLDRLRQQTLSHVFCELRLPQPAEEGSVTRTQEDGCNRCGTMAARLLCLFPLPLLCFF
jgi:hypothetical protein